MAGFDFSVPYKPAETEFIKSLLLLAQKRARFYNVDLKFKRKSGEFYVTVDGPLNLMQSFLKPLIIAVLSLAEGSRHFQPAAKRRKIARRITVGYADGLDKITDLVEHISGVFGSAPNSYWFDPGDATHLLANSER